MRVHADDIRGRNTNKARRAGRAQVLLNGAVVDKVIEADEENGFILKYAQMKDGSIEHNEFGAMHELLLGAVTIKIR